MARFIEYGTYDGERVRVHLWNCALGRRMLTVWLIVGLVALAFLLFAVIDAFFPDE